MKTKICLITSVICYTSFVFSQDIHFSQFYMSPLTQNPGMAGVDDDLEAIINYKDQWRSVATPYKTIAASVDARLNKKKIKDGFWAGGLNFFSDRAGDAKMGITQINLSVACHLSITKYHTLGIGLQGGYAQRSINYNSLQWASQYDPNSGYNSSLASGESMTLPSFFYGDFAAGVVWSFNNTSGLIHTQDNHDLKANIGVSVFHFKQKYSFYKTSEEKLYPKFVLHGNALISLPNTNVAIVPGLIYYRQGPSQEIYIGSLIRYKLQQDSKFTGIKKGAALNIGGYYRMKDGVTASFLLEYSSYAIGISYDFNTSKLRTASTGRGGIEISLRYVTPNPFQQKRMASFN